MSLLVFGQVGIFFGVIVSSGSSLFMKQMTQHGSKEYFKKIKTHFEISRLCQMI